MSVVLISPYPDLTAFGPRTLCACLRRAGIETRMVFLPDPTPEVGQAGPERYSPAVLAELDALCADARLVGISLMRFLELFTPSELLVADASGQGPDDTRPGSPGPCAPS